jgi:hypothetical protein
MIDRLGRFAQPARIALAFLGFLVLWELFVRG